MWLLIDGDFFTALAFLLGAYVFTLSIVAIDEQISLISDAPNEW